jgi:hypothetical protein
MVMNRFLLVLVAAAGIGACNKPSADDCRQAIHNMQELLRTDSAARNTDNEAEVRLCKGGSSKEAVACAINAKTPEELKACAFMTSKSASKSSN